MAIYSKVIEGLTNGDEMFVKVFTVNPKGRVNNRVDLPFANCIPSEFPAEPSSYNLIGTYSDLQTWTAPENGYFEIELHGASGNGAEGIIRPISSGPYTYFACGGGGGGAGCAISRVKLNKGDTIIFVLGAVGNITTAEIRSTIETYNMMQVTNADDGSVGTTGVQSHSCKGGVGGAGGVGSGGNHANYTGGTGGTGDGYGYATTFTAYGGIGGEAGYSGGNDGGDGGGVVRTGSSLSSASTTSNETGKAGFVKIYRGDTNVVA